MLNYQRVTTSKHPLFIFFFRNFLYKAVAVFFGFDLVSYWGHPPRYQAGELAESLGRHHPRNALDSGLSSWWTMVKSMVFHMVKPCWNHVFFHMVVLEVSYGQSWGYWSSIFRRFSIVKIVKQPFWGSPTTMETPWNLMVSSRKNMVNLRLGWKFHDVNHGLWYIYIYYHK